MDTDSPHTHAHMHVCMHARTHAQPFYGSLDFVRDNLSEPLLEKTFTHSCLSWSSVIPYLLPPSTTIHGFLPIQITCVTVYSTISLQVFFALPLGLAPSTLHTPYISSPNHCLLFAAHAHTIATCFATVPRLCHLILVSLSTLYLEFYLVAAVWSATSFSFLTGQVSLLCNILLRTQLLYNLPLTVNDISSLVSNGTICLIYSIQFEFWSPQLHQHLRLHSPE